MRYLPFGVFWLLFPGISNAQDSTFSYHANVEAALATAQTPFWLHANQFGTLPIRGPFVAGQVGFNKLATRPNARQKAFAWSAGVELAAYAGPQSTLFLTDAYLAGWIGPVELSVGQRKETVGLMDTTLTSGSLSISGNSRPFPRIQLAIPQYFSLGFTRNFVAIKGSYSDGYLGKAPVIFGLVNEVPNVYLHHKSLYIRLGKPSQRLHLHGGFNHQAMWGGEDLIFTGGLAPVAAYKYVVIGKSWHASRVGNHFGTIDMAAEWRAKNWTYFAYRQNLYEDGSLAGLTNIKDGLNGLRISRGKVYGQSDFQFKSLLIEFLNTKSQGGDIFDPNTKVFGRDNYYNHYVYKQGWSYRGRSLGTPVIPTQDLQRSDIPKKDSSLTVDNRLWAIHLGVIGKFRDIDFLAKGTFSRNFGTYDFVINPARTQFSLLLEAEKPIAFASGSFLSFKLAADLGQTVSQQWSIGSRLAQAGDILEGQARFF